jgi:D-amino-acid dehydrogenase
MPGQGLPDDQGADLLGALVGEHRFQFVGMPQRRVLDPFPEVGAILLECTNFVPYSQAMRRATGVPVYDLYTLVMLIYQATMGRDFTRRAPGQVRRQDQEGGCVSAGEESADVVVVGGGIIGVCTALQLQRTGRRVTVIERRLPGEEASGYNAGVFAIDCLPTGMPSVLRSLPRLLRDPLSPLAIRWGHLPRLAPWLVRFALACEPGRVEAISIGLSSLMSQAVEAYCPLVEGTEAEAILQNHGFLHLYRTEDSFRGARFDLDLRSRRGVDYEVMDAEAIGRVSPQLAGRFQRGVYFSKARFTTDPQAFTRILTAAFTARGGEVRSAEVRDFAVAGRRVDAVLTSAGPIPAGAVVVCAGPWSGRLARRLGLRVPLGVERGYGIDLPDPGVTLPCATLLSDFHIAITPHRGGLRIAGLDELAGISAPARPRLARRIVEAAKIAFPELRTTGAVTWMRQRPSMPDSLPVIGRAPGHDNAFLAFGHGHKGLGTAAITGKLIQQQMDREPPAIDLGPFDPARFSLRPGRHRRRRPPATA